MKCSTTYFSAKGKKTRVINDISISACEGVLSIDKHAHAILALTWMYIVHVEPRKFKLDHAHVENHQHPHSYTNIDHVHVSYSTHPY